MSSYDSYRDYLHSEVWLRLREQALEKAGWRCQICNKEKSLQVHHRKYAKKWGEESVSDLTVLCLRCHKVATRRLMPKKKKKHFSPQIKTPVITWPTDNSQQALKARRDEGRRAKAG
jgi:hypothetical protein